MTRRWLWWAPALALVGVTALPAAALDPREFLRPCKRPDLLGVWRVMRFGFAAGAAVDRNDPAYLPHQRYVFHSNATMAYATQDVPFSPEAQRELVKLPTTATWAMEPEGRLIRQRDGVPAVETADCQVVLSAINDPKGSQPRAQRGDILLTEVTPDHQPITRRLLRRIRRLGD
jgi:hypothetical protein